MAQVNRPVAARGTVRLQGGPHSADLRVDVADGHGGWLPLRGVTSLTYEATAGDLPHLIIWVEGSRVDLLTEPERAGLHIMRERSS